MAMQEEAKPLAKKTLYEFDGFRVDPINRLLLRDGEVVPLTAKVFDILLVFLENSGRLLEKEEVMRKVWQHSFVEEGNLTRNVSTLRKALGEDPKSHQYIVTIPGRGYKFVAAIRILTEPVTQIVIEEQTHSTTIIEEEINLTESANGWLALRKAQGRTRVAFILAGLGLLGLFTILAGNPLINKWRESGSTKPKGVASPLQLTKFTTTGNTLFGSISPDGKFAAFVSRESDRRQSIWLEQVATGSRLRVVPAAAELSYWGLTFSPDSNFLYYVVEDQAHLGKGALYRLPVVGGTPEKLLTNVGTHPSFSPDGKQMVFKRVSANKNDLIVADHNGGNQQVWATGSSHYDFWGYSWSPSGQTIAYANSRQDEAGRYWYLAEMPVNGGTERAITKRRYKAIRGIAWLPDAQSLVVVAEDSVSGLFQLWQLSVEDGTERRLTNDVNDYWRVSVTADGSALLTSQQQRPSNIFVASMSDPRQARQITPGVADYDTLAWTAGNRLVYSNLHNGMYDLWTIEADGSGQKRLTANSGQNKFPAVSADGHFILFVSNRKGRSSVWRMEVDGSNARQIGGETTGRVQGSPDGREVFYSTDAMDGWGLWKVPFEGGEPQRVRDLYYYRASISPDGKLLAYTYLDDELGKVRLAISPVNSNQPIRTFDADIGYEVIRWVEGGSAVAYIGSGNHEIRIQPIAAGKPRVLLTVADELFSFDVSRDGQQLAYISGRVTNDLILMRNFYEADQRESQKLAATPRE